MKHERVKQGTEISVKCHITGKVYKATCLNNEFASERKGVYEVAIAYKHNGECHYAVRTKEEPEWESGEGELLGYRVIKEPMAILDCLAGNITNDYLKDLRKALRRYNTVFSPMHYFTADQLNAQP